MEMQGSLGEIQALMQPMKTENGLQRPILDQKAAMLSLQLASVAYTQQMTPWRESGWKDVSYHIDHTLLTGEDANGGDGSNFSGVMSEYKQFMARFRAKSTNIINQVLGTVRNKDESDTCKAIVMIHKDVGGRYLVAIGFMGTGKRVYDWLANFRIEEEEKMHKGCLQLARSFEENVQDIVFLETAKELGLEKLTLFDIMQECKKGDSRFKLWLAGHSQGGAVMQIFAYRALLQGVLRKNLIGYGFASPSVMYDAGEINLRSVPLFHIMNRDDLTPRLGARLHIGRCLCYDPTEEMRNICYGSAWQEEGFRRVFSMVQGVRNNEDAMLFILALLRSIEELSDGAAVQAVSELLGRMLPEKMTILLGGRMDEGIRMMRRFVERNYFHTTGERKLPLPRLEGLKKSIGQEMGRLGARGFMKNLMQVMGIPHRMRMKESYGKTIPAYTYIIKNEMESLYTALTLAHPSCVGEDRRALRRERKRFYGRFGYAQYGRTASERRSTGKERR